MPNPTPTTPAQRAGKRILVRDVLRYGPDGNAVRKTETIQVQLQCDSDLDAPPGGYDIASEWRLMPKSQEKPNAS